MIKTTVDLANEYIAISQVLILLDVEVPESYSGSSWKSHCPFEDFYHIDRGRAKSLRVYYGTNSAYCFAGCGYMSPVSLYALKTGLSKVEAASLLLAKEGYELPSFDSEFTELLKKETVINKASLREALQVFCKRVVGLQWSTKQFENSVIKGIDNCLTLLARVESSEEAQQWLNLSKKYMKKILEGT